MSDTLKSQIVDAYIQYTRSYGKRPPNVYIFMKELETHEEKDFYEHYSSFTEIDRELWDGYLAEALDRMKSEDIYVTYSTREKILALFFTLLEVLKENRSFILGCFPSGIRYQALTLFEKSFLSFVEFLIEEGMQNGEIERRMFLTSKYPYMLYQQWLYVLRFWLKDDSHSFEQTDAAVEKSTQLCFDFMERNVLDSTFDLLKFTFGKRS